MELSKILFGDPILPVFGIEKSQLVKNTTQESGYSPTFLSKYHIGDVVLGKILENLGNGKGTFLINGTVLAGYMPEYLKQNDVLSFQLQRSQSGDVALLLHSIPNSHSEKTRFTAEQIASLLGIQNEDEGITSAINTLKNAGQPITKDAVFTLLRLVENTRANPVLNSFTTTNLFDLIESMMQEGVPLSEKNISLFAQSVGSFEKLENAIKSLVQNGRIPETLPLRQAIILLASSFLPLLNASTGQKNTKELPTKQLEMLQQKVVDIGTRYLGNSEAVSATFSSLFSGQLTKAEEKIAVFELLKHLSEFLLAHPKSDKEDIQNFLQIKQQFSSDKNISPEVFQKSLQSLHSIFLHTLSKPETSQIDLHLPEQEIAIITPKLLLLFQQTDLGNIIESLDQFIRNYEQTTKEQFLQREKLQSVIKQLFTLSDNKQLPISTKLELLHSIVRSEITTTQTTDELPKILLSYLRDITHGNETNSVQMQKFTNATEVLFRKFMNESSVNADLLVKEIRTLFDRFFPKNVQTNFEKEIDALLQFTQSEEITQNKQQTNEQRTANVIKNQFQQSYKEVFTSALETLNKFVQIPEHSRTAEQIEVMKNISILLHTLGAFEAYNTVANVENLPLYMILPMIVERSKKRQFELKRIRIERHQAGDEKELYQFGFSIPTNTLSEVNVRGSYLDRRITMQLFVETASIKRSIEMHQDMLMDGLQENGYSVVSMSITTKEQHQQLPPMHDSMKHDWRV